MIPWFSLAQAKTWNFCRFNIHCPDSTDVVVYKESRTDPAFMMQAEGFLSESSITPQFHGFSSVVTLKMQTPLGGTLTSGKSFLSAALTSDHIIMCWIFSFRRSALMCPCLPAVFHKSGGGKRIISTPWKRALRYFPCPGFNLHVFVPPQDERRLIVNLVPAALFFFSFLFRSIRSVETSRRRFVLCLLGSFPGCKLSSGCSVVKSGAGW